jgi:hypothetical protein
MYEWQQVALQFGHFVSQSFLQHSLWHVGGLGVGAGVGRHFAALVHEEQALTVWMYEWQHVVLQLGHFVSQSDLQHSLAQSPAYEDPISAKIKITGAHVLIPIAEYICCL